MSILVTTAEPMIDVVELEDGMRGDEEADEMSECMTVRRGEGSSVWSWN